MLSVQSVGKFIGGSANIIVMLALAFSCNSLPQLYGDMCGDSLFQIAVWPLFASERKFVILAPVDYSSLR